MISIWAEIIGFIGVFLVLLAYLGFQMKRMSGDGVPYLVLNIVGAAGILVPVLAADQMNWPVLVIELAWGLISFYGLWRALARHTKEEQSS